MGCLQFYFCILEILLVYIEFVSVGTSCFVPYAVMINEENGHFLLENFIFHCRILEESERSLVGFAFFVASTPC